MVIVDVGSAMIRVGKAGCTPVGVPSPPEALSNPEACVDVLKDAASQLGFAWADCYVVGLAHAGLEAGHFEGLLSLFLLLLGAKGVHLTSQLEAAVFGSGRVNGIAVDCGQSSVTAGAVVLGMGGLVPWSVGSVEVKDEQPAHEELNELIESARAALDDAKTIEEASDFVVIVGGRASSALAASLAPVIKGPGQPVQPCLPETGEADLAAWQAASEMATAGSITIFLDEAEVQAHLEAGEALEALIVDAFGLYGARGDVQ